MLQTQSVSPQLLELLRFVMLQPAFLRYHLAGGTSLALQIGHRISVDLDMFGEEMPDEAYPILLENKSWAEIKSEVLKGM